MDQVILQRNHIAAPDGVFVAHDRVPGRVRLRALALRRRAILGPLLEAALRAQPGVRDASVRTVTGSLIIEFDPRRISAEALRDWTARYLSDAIAGRQREREGQLERPAPVVRELYPWASRPAEEIYAALASSPAGLSSAEAARRRADAGPNRLPEVGRRTNARILRDQLISAPNLMLTGAVGLSLATGGWVDAAVIAAVMALNGGIGFGTERYAEGAIRGLQRLGAPRARVLRDDLSREIDGAEVVAGDVVQLRPGDVVPADGRVIRSHALTVDEATLTGESSPATKVAQQIPSPSSIDACRNLVFMGTAVATGHGRALVTDTGARTQIGRITTLVGEETAPRTRLQEGLDHLAKRLGRDVLAVCAGMFVLGVGLGLPALRMLQTAVALAISAVPEGLPAVATTALAAGMARMLRRRVVIRKLAAVEALGGVTVLCVDKTGTLTQNRMRLVEVWVDGRCLPFAAPPFSPSLRRLIEVGALCNEADLEVVSRTRRVRGSATEGALLLAAADTGVDVTALRESYPLLEIRRRGNGSPLMATLHGTPKGAFRLCVKGAPEVVLAVCGEALIDGQPVPLTPALRRRILASNEGMAARGHRVLGYAEAVRDVPDVNNLHPGALIWLGLTGLEDPLRPGIAASIARCRGAGIRTVILTGDHPATAAAVARALGIAREGDARVAEAHSLIGLPPDQLRERVAHVDVYARVSPEDKLHIVRALQANGEVVAMTGDGVNDGPALKAADVGIAMGGQGTEVAREIADVVLLEDDFEPMAYAIEQGRAITGNIRRSLRFLVASNLSEVISVGAALLTRTPIPMSPLQMLWMNLVSDVVPALALTLEPPPPDGMRRPPRPPDEPLLTQDDWRTTSRDAITLAASTMGVYHWAARRHGPGMAAQTLAFTSSCLAEIFYALACGSPFIRTAGPGRARPNGPLLAAVAGTAALQATTLLVPPLRRLLRLTLPGRGDWLPVVIGALLPVALAKRTRSEPPRRQGQEETVPLW